MPAHRREDDSSGPRRRAPAAVRLVRQGAVRLHPPPLRRPRLGARRLPRAAGEPPAHPGRAAARRARRDLVAVQRLLRRTRSPRPRRGVDREDVRRAPGPACPSRCTATRTALAAAARAPSSGPAPCVVAAGRSRRSRARAGVTSCPPGPPHQDRAGPRGRPGGSGGSGAPVLRASVPTGRSRFPGRPAHLLLDQLAQHPRLQAREDVEPTVERQPAEKRERLV